MSDRPKASGDGPDLEGREAIYAFADRLQQGAGEEEEEREELETWVTFRVGERALGLGVGSIQEIVRVGEITRVPHSPPAVRGAIGYRDRVLPLVDLGLRLGGDEIEIEDASRVLVATAHGRLIGLLVDRALRVVTLAPSTFEAPGTDLGSALQAVVRAVAPREDGAVVLLEVERLLALEERNASEENGS